MAANRVSNIVLEMAGQSEPFHGYYFRILTRQGEAARRGKMNYFSQYNLMAGFALVAYPEHWGQRS
jgi:hypothetical protein